MSVRYVFFCIVIVLLASCAGNPAIEPTTIPAATPAAEGGKTIFFAKCASCHMVNKELTGPPLKGVESRWPDKQKLYAFIRNSQEIIKKDKYAHDLWLQYNQTIMTAHPDLTDAQIRNVLDYIKLVSSN